VQPERRTRTIRSNTGHPDTGIVTTTDDHSRRLVAPSHRKARWPSNLSCRRTPARHSGSAVLHRVRGRYGRSPCSPMDRGRYPPRSPIPLHFHSSISRLTTRASPTEVVMFRLVADMSLPWHAPRSSTEQFPGRFHRASRIRGHPWGASWFCRRPRLETPNPRRAHRLGDTNGLYLHIGRLGTDRAIW